MNLKTKIKVAASNNLGAALEQLESLLPDDSSEFNALLILAKRNRRLKKTKLLGIERTEDLNRLEDKLLFDFMEILDDLDPAIFSATSPFFEEQLFYEKIVVVCTTDRLAYMKQFFSNYYFKSIFYYEEDKAAVEDADLVLFDDKKPSSESKIFLQKLLDANNYIIYFGAKFPLSRDVYADRVYYANSIFSLYARIKEMLDFLKYINPK